MANNGTATQDDIQEIQFFVERAAEHKTPRNDPKIKVKIDKHDPIVIEDSVTQRMSLQP